MVNLFRIGTAVSEIGRAREIIGIVVKYGFNDWVSKNGLGKYLVTKKRLTRIGKYNTWERVRMAIDELGPTFIKFGQIMADRPDIIPEPLRLELSKLQDEAEPMSDDIAIKAIEKELKRPLMTVFREFDCINIASASIAQVYRATLQTGEEVCVKIQRPDINNKIELDLNLMEYFAGRMQRNNPEMEAIDVLGVVKEFGKTIRKELDFMHEAANIVRFRHNFEGDPDVYVPKVYSEYTTEKVIVEEYITGIKISDTEALIEAGNDPVLLARKAVRTIFDMIFNHGFFHADPHPGNIFVLENNIITFIDFGMMGSLREEQLFFLGKYALGYIQRDPHSMTEALLLVSGKRHFSQKRELEFQIGEMMAHYRYLPIEEMDFGRVLQESIDIIVKFGLKIPPSIYLLVKCLATIERVSVTLYPGIDFVDEMQPYAVALFARQFDPKTITREVFDSLKEYYRLVMELPSELNEIISKIKEGKFKTLIEIKGFEPLVEEIEQTSNRVSIAIVLAALIIGGSIISQQEDIRWIGTTIFILAGIFGFWLLIKLLRRGKY
ncbi:MAG: AarF/ABC1/UbiB kinase family protein [Bacteroidales bacterium]|nr:AarF/ABC1/UbiB kinase family protein [Bacteroidales bacterium]